MNKKTEKKRISSCDICMNYTYDEAPNYVLEKATCGSTKNPTDGVPQTTGLKWRIFNIDNTNKKIELVSEKLPAKEIVRRAVYSKIGKLSKSDIAELCPSIG